MAQSQIDLEKLRAEMVSDATQTKDLAQSAFSTRGAPEESSFAPKAFQVGRKAFGEAELASAHSAIDKLIAHYKTEAAFKDQTEAGKFELDMKKRLNQYKMAAIRQAGILEKRMAKAGLDAAQRQKMLQGVAGLTETAAFGIAMGIGGSGGGEVAGTEGVQAPMSPAEAMGEGPTSSQVPAPGSPGSFGIEGI